MPEIDAAMCLSWTHGQEYSGARWEYCPWCGKTLTEEKDDRIEVVGAGFTLGAGVTVVLDGSPAATDLP